LLQGNEVTHSWVFSTAVWSEVKSSCGWDEDNSRPSFYVKAQYECQ